MAVFKQRLDSLLVERGLFPTRARAAAAVLAAQVLVNGVVCDKPGVSFKTDAVIELVAIMPWASRGGLKLEGALDALSLDPAGKRCLDLGASHGGFTDVLLTRRAASVAAVDVGRGQLLTRLVDDSRVVILDKHNARELSPDWFAVSMLPFHLVVADLSFISLRLILPVLPPVLKNGSELLLLVKPQFELGRELVKTGVVRDDRLREAAVEQVSSCAREFDMLEKNRVDSSVPGPQGNREIFLHLVYTRKDGIADKELL